MARRTAVTDRILAQHAGRDPERLRLKDALLRRDPFAFLRGTAFLFWERWSGGMLDRAPAAWICGDLHVDNFGTYKGANRLVYFDVNDFDEACLAPLPWDLGRLLASVRVAARVLDAGRRTGDGWVAQTLAHYCDAMEQGQALWLERATACGPIRRLLRRAARRGPEQLLAGRVVAVRDKPRLDTAGRHALPLEKAERKRVKATLQHWLAGAAPGAGQVPGVLDVARRIAGNGSLGVERYVALARAGAGRGEPFALIDVKRATPASAAVHSPCPQPAWRDEAERVVTVQRLMQAASPAMLGVVRLEGRACVVRELLPSEDRLSIQKAVAEPGGVEALLEAAARVLAWNQLRAAGRRGAAPADDLIEWAGRGGWGAGLAALSRELADAVVDDWESFRSDGRRLGGA